MDNKENRSQNLVKNTLLLSINRLISPIVAFLLLPIYTNNISTSEYGMTDVIQTYVSLLVPVLLVRLDIGMFRFLVERRGDKKAVSEIVTNTIAIAAPLTIVASIAMIIAIVCNVLPFHTATLFYFISVLINNLVGPLARGLGKNGLFAAASISDVVLKLVFGIVFVLIMQMGGYGLMLSLGFATLVNNIICIIGVLSDVSIKKELINKALRRELIRFSVPIVADGVSFWVINTSDRTVVSLVLGASANGIYAVANKFSNLISSMTTIFWMSWSEQASVAVKDENYPEFVSKTFNSYFKIAASITMCMIAIVPILFRFTVGPDYGEASIYIPLLIIGLFLNAIAAFYGPIYLAYKKTKEVAISTGVAAIVNLLVDLALVWFVGIWAAVISTIVAYLAMLLYRCVDVRRLIKIRYDKRIYLATIIAMAACVGLYYINNMIAAIINIILSIGIAIILNKKIITKILRTTIKRLKRHN